MRTRQGGVGVVGGGEGEGQLRAAGGWEGGGYAAVTLTPEAGEVVQGRGRWPLTLLCPISRACIGDVKINLRFVVLETL